MKVWIWIGCIFVFSFINAGLQTSGIRLGVIPSVLLWGGMFWLAGTLCKCYDQKKSGGESKNDDK